MSCRACEGFTSMDGMNELPKIFETENIVGYIVTNHAASRGHCLVLPRSHYEKMHQIPDQILNEIIISLKKLANIMGVENYNVLQNNGALAFQTLFHAYFHLIPKNSTDDGLRYLRDEGSFTNVDQSEILDEILKKWE